VTGRFVGAVVGGGHRRTWPPTRRRLRKTVQPPRLVGEPTDNASAAIPAGLGYTSEAEVAVGNDRRRSSSSTPATSARSLRVDVLVNNAGVASTDPSRSRMERHSRHW
jgi:hypothetical protein